MHGCETLSQFDGIDALGSPGKLSKQAGGTVQHFEGGGGGGGATQAA
jgi:hypothetical protein